MSQSERDDRITQLLTDILAKAHPLMAEALYLASIPHWYDEGVFTAVRAKDDGRNEKLVSHYLQRYSFVVPLTDNANEEGDTAYQIRAYERSVLQRFFLVDDPVAYRAAHERSFAYWRDNPDPNPLAQDQNYLYHLLFVDEQAGMDYLVSRFRVYYDDRLFSAMENLLVTAKEARTYLALLTDEPVAQLSHMLALMNARMAQLRGEWDKSRHALEALRAESNLSPDIQPYIARAYGVNLASQGQYVEAVREYYAATEAFDTLPQTPENLAERAQTLIDMGDAYVDLAVSARGEGESRVGNGRFQHLINFTNFFLSMPLVIYLSFSLGSQVWLPRFWAVFEGLDWIIARLFAQGARHYRDADPILEEHGTPAEGAAADERLANLYLTMGAAQKAEGLFRRLLADEKLAFSEYRRAIIGVGLGQALQQQGLTTGAREVLEDTLPALTLYEDNKTLAKVHAIIAENFVIAANIPDAVGHWRQALKIHRQQENQVGQTRIAERLKQHGDLETAASVVNRTYPVQFRHIATYIFQRISSVAGLVLVFLIPIFIIRVETGSIITPEITFQATPLLQSTNADFLPQITQGVTGSALAPPSTPTVLLWLALELLLIYLGLFTILGYIAIVRTPLRQVQARGTAEALHVDAKGIRVGQQPPILWQNITHITQANVALFNSAIPDLSQYMIETPTQRLVIPGRADAYDSLCRRVETAAAPNKAIKHTNLSFSMLLSPLGALYVVTGLLLLLISLLSLLAPTLLNVDFIGAYSLGDLYPYLYLGLFMPIMWWFFVRPSQSRIRAGATGPTPFWLLGFSLFILLLSWFIGFHPWLTVPDLYPSITAVTMAASALLMIWQARSVNDQSMMYAPVWRWGSIVISTVIIVVMGSYLWREVWGYHYLVMGHTWRDRAVVATETAVRDEYLLNATLAYGQSKSMAQLRVMGLDGRDAADSWFGVPTASQTTWVAATNGASAMYAMRGDFEKAVDGYSEMLPYTDKKARAYASRAVAYQGMGTSESEVEAGVVDINRAIYQQALDNYDLAIDLDSDDGSYFLWRGVGYHALKDNSVALANYEESLTVQGETALSASSRVKAWTGKAWILYADGDYEGAVDSFQNALDEAAEANDLADKRRFWQTPLNTVSDKTVAQAGLGLGYAYYSLRQYDDALVAWDEAAQRDPTDPLIPISLGTLYWRIGTLGDDLEARGNNRCVDDSLSEAEWLQSEAELERAIELFDQAIAIEGQEPADVAFTYRTKAQVLFLLKDCPNYDRIDTLSAAMDSYSKAIALDPENPLYWHIRGRLAYSAWYNSPPGTGLQAREWLFQAAADNNQALALDNEDRLLDGFNYVPNEWQEIIERQAVEGTLARGDTLLASGDFAQAYNYYALVAQNRPENSDALGSAALAAVATENVGQAADWLERGIATALANGDETAVLEARNRLVEFLQERPLAPELDSLFAQTGLDFNRPASAEMALDWALSAWETGETDKAWSLVDEGVVLALRQGEFVPLQAFIFAVPADGVALVEPITAALPEMVNVIDEETAVSDLLAVYTVAVVGEDYEAAAQLAHEIIGRTTDTATNLTLLRNLVQRDLRGWWGKAEQLPGEALVTAHQAALPDFLAAQPERAQQSYFWRYQAWYKFYLGLTWFRLGDEAGAAVALAAAQVDTVEAERIIPGEHTYVFTYLPEGGLGWFYLVRGNDAVMAGDLEAAQADYAAAVAAYKPVENGDARHEIAEAAFKAGAVSLQLGEIAVAEAWYAQGVELVDEYGSDKALTDAREALTALMAEDDYLAEVGNGILDMLE